MLFSMISGSVAGTNAGFSGSVIPNQRPISASYVVKSISQTISGCFVILLIFTEIFNNASFFL